MTKYETGLPLELTEFLRDIANVTTFIETGTGLGRTAKIASEMFDYVATVEADKSRWEYNTRQFLNTNVDCIYGKSHTELWKLLSVINRTTIVFLDAHCSYREAIDDTPCPLLDEIGVIPSQHIVIIDDEHSFTKPHKVAKVAGIWPELTDVIMALAKRDNPYIIIVGKAIVAIPRQYKQQVLEFYQEQ